MDPAGQPARHRSGVRTGRQLSANPGAWRPARPDLGTELTEVPPAVTRLRLCRRPKLAPPMLYAWSRCGQTSPTEGKDGIRARAILRQVNRSPAAERSTDRRPYIRSR